MDSDDVEHDECVVPRPHSLDFPRLMKTILYIAVLMSEKDSKRVKSLDHNIFQDLASNTSTPTLIYRSANQMYRTYPINQPNCLKIGKR